MIENQTIRAVRRGRIFPEIQWSEAQKSQWKAEQASIYQHCKAIFEQLNPELMQNYYNWYIAIDPVSGDYVIDADIEAATKKARQQHLDSIPCLFRINETGVCGTI